MIIALLYLYCPANTKVTDIITLDNDRVGKAAKYAAHISPPNF